MRFDLVVWDTLASTASVAIFDKNTSIWKCIKWFAPSLCLREMRDSRNLQIGFLIWWIIEA